VLAEIILPQSYIQRQAVSKKAGIFTFVTWSDIAERSIEFDEFRAQLASLHTENLIALISMISIIQSNTPSLYKVFQAQQCALVQQLCAPEIAEEIVRKINRGERDALTSEEQLLQAALFAILYSASGPAQDMPSKSVDELGEFLLKANDVISNGDHGDGEKYSPIELFIKLSMRHHSRTLQEQPRYLLVRYYDLLVTRSQELGNPKFDFDEAMHNATGLHIEEFMALAFLYYAPFGDKSEVRQLAAYNFWGMIREIETRIRKPEMRESVQKTFGYTRAEFRRAFRNGASNPLDISLLPFKKRPFYRTTNGSALPISLPFVLEKFSAGTYWTLHGWYCDQSKKAMNAFTDFVGDRFQDYGTDLLVRTYSGVAFSGQHFYSEQEIRVVSPNAPRGERPPFDAALIGEDSLVIFEITTESIPVTVLERGNPGEFTAAAQERLGKKFEQLKNACNGLANGIWSAPGLDRRKIRHIYPVLVLLHPYPQNMATWKLLQEHIPIPELIQCGSEFLTAEVHHAQILTAEELEMLEPFLHSGQYSLPNLLKAKTGDEFWMVQSMKNFLLKGLKIEEQSNEYMLTRYNEITVRMRQVIADEVDLPHE